SLIVLGSILLAPVVLEVAAVGGVGRQLNVLAVDLLRCSFDLTLERLCVLCLTALVVGPLLVVDPCGLADQQAVVPGVDAEDALAAAPGVQHLVDPRGLLGRGRPGKVDRYRVGMAVRRRQERSHPGHRVLEGGPTDRGGDEVVESAVGRWHLVGGAARVDVEAGAGRPLTLEYAGP